ncbi:phosphatase PAP2 family protein [Rheinheimera sp.]|uniref:phosphatase PAP2 family protein n=1 Tax=Rheinheimera sp. TaxID=1869214 RepID=UPI0027BA87E5|nr:phosphatase PAP2 family protein [Rheinheimera sp.]
MKLARLAAFDQYFFTLLFQRFGSSALAPLCRACSRTADGPCYAALALVLWLAHSAAVLDFVFLLALAYAIELPAYLLLKNLFRRQRPVEFWQGKFQAHILPSDRFSLPSGHTAGAFVLLGVVAMLAPFWLIVVFPWALAVGLSRILLGVHFPGDVCAGAALGLTAVLLAQAILFP